MKLTKKTEKALLTGAAFLFVLLVCIAIALLVSPEEEAEIPAAPSPRPTAVVTEAPVYSLNIAGKPAAPGTDTFFLHMTSVSEDDKAKISTLTGLRTLSLTDCGLTEIGFIAPLKDLTTLYLSSNSIRDLSPLTGMTSLRTLYLDGNPLDNLRPLYDLPSLQTLSLQSVPLSSATLESLQLALPQCKIFDDAVSGAARPLMLGGMGFTAEDTELYLSSRGISDISILSQCPGLRVLDLSGNPLDGVGVLKQLSALHTLNLASTGLTDSELRIVMGIRSLRWLNITGNEDLSGEVIDETISALPGCQVIHDPQSYRIKLGTQTLRSNIDTLSMPNASLGSIGPLRKCTGLLTVDLSGNYISDLTPLSGNTGMTSLFLKGNRVTSCDGLYTLTLLQTLDLSSNRLTDVSALSGCMYLSWLDVSNNQLTYLAPLYGCINLRYLDLRGNPADWDTVEALRAALPGCEILTDAQPPVIEIPVYTEAPVFYEDPVPVPPDYEQSPETAGDTPFF